MGATSTTEPEYSYDQIRYDSLTKVLLFSNDFSRTVQLFDLHKRLLFSEMSMGCSFVLPQLLTGSYVWKIVQDGISQSGRFTI